MIENEISNYLRVNSALMINKANSGHPGVCLGAAPIVYSIYKNAFVNPKKPNFINRDRVVFSAGHASALIYSCLHLFDFDISLQDLQKFRQINSITTGHPEAHLTPGVDDSTGPLGQGIANAVGFAIAEAYLNARFKKDNFSPINHYTYCFTGDGCLMEGVAQEAISIAGNLKLNKLIMLYDRNNITIEGDLSISNGENTKQKFLACNWNVLEVEDGNKITDIDKAISNAKKSDKPTIIIINTKIGYGCELVGSHKVHGKPLNEEQIKNLRQNIGYSVPDWEISKEVKSHINKLLKQKETEYNNYLNSLKEYEKKYLKEYNEFLQLINEQTFDITKIVSLPEKTDKFDGREEMHLILNALAKFTPNIIGGCADVGPSTKANILGEYFTANNRLGKNIPYGIREHAMGAISNGIALHSGLKSFCSTYFCFANYLTPAIRISAMSGLPVLYLMTHDSVAVGEDGPTHQSIEQIATLRSMPCIYVMRPSGREELLTAYNTFLNCKKPVAIVLPRQVTGYVNNDFEGSKKGGYILENPQNYHCTIIATGSEVPLIVNAQQTLKNYGINAKIVSMPCVEIFEEQSREYKNSVVDKTKPVFCVEASSDNIWYRYVTSNETLININCFGLSGKSEEVYNYFGFNVENVVNKVVSFFKK